MRSQVVPVGLLTAYVRELVDRDPLLADLWVEGEISDLFHAKSGHLYFTLRDDDGQLKCVLFRTHATQLGIVPRAGDQIAAHGHVTVYPRDGAIQLYVDLIQPAGVGVAALERERLRQQLDAEGLFDDARKRLLPTAPQCIGVVTSPDGAAWHDIQQVIGRRYPFAHLILSPTSVQGSAAPEAIVSALKLLQADGRAAMIILARGGGSAEDLWAFNDERVVRAVFACKVPVVTGVGHETDRTLVDEVADLRAPTPSAAAELSVPSIADFPQRIHEARRSLARYLEQRVADHRANLGATRLNLRRTSPVRLLQTRRQNHDDAAAATSAEIRKHLRQSRMSVANERALLDILDPIAVLDRGYAVVEDAESGKLIARVADAPAGQSLRISWIDGAALSHVRESGHFVSPWREDDGVDGLPA